VTLSLQMISHTMRRIMVTRDMAIMVEELVASITIRLARWPITMTLERYTKYISATMKLQRSTWSRRSNNRWS